MMNGFDSAAFARRIKALRKERGMDQDALALASGVSKGSIVRYELGTSVPRVDIVVSLARALGCSCDVLIGVVPLAVA
jgi:transcriptional regulator with XRE-family HTH domain